MSHSDPHFQREQQKYANPIVSREFILQHLAQHLTGLPFDQLIVDFKLIEQEHIEALLKRLRAMERDGQLFFNRHQRYVLPEQLGFVRGKVLGRSQGFGFLNVDGQKADWFIPNFEMQGLLPGDYVLAKPAGDSKGKVEARIVRVISPRSEPIVGRYFKEKGLGVVIPEDPRICHEIIVLPENTGGARHGNVVVVELERRPTRSQSAVGKISEVLGEHMAPGMEIQIAVRNHDVPYIWPNAVVSQAEKLADYVTDADKLDRVDLTALPLITIDGEDARDFDDAVYCERKKSGGWRLWVAIADVSHYVRLGSAIDEEAQNRATSVYFPSEVIPMLPEKLSNGLCSLNPHVDRLCMVCEMTVSEAGNLSGFRFYEAVMHSKARMTYTKVAAILAGDPALREQYAAIVPDIEQLHALYSALKGARHERGAFEFDTVETRFIFNSQRKIERIEPVVRNDAHKLIEECMILANVAAAKVLEKHQVPGLFRVHDKPSPEKFANFIHYLAEMGVEVNLPADPEPKQIMELLEKLADNEQLELIQITLLRSMKQAVYQEENIGHFGLNLKQYAHFTSPIRRYPDLVVHRAIKSILKAEGTVTHGEHRYKVDEIDELGEHCSMAERRADEASREVSDWLKCEFMQDHLGMEFHGVVSSVTNFGVFVRLDGLYIEGLIHVTALPKDFYHYDVKKQMLIGEHTRQSFRMGDTVEVKVAGVNLEERKIDLVLQDGGKATKASGKLKGAAGKGFARGEPQDGRQRSSRGRKDGESSRQRGGSDERESPRRDDDKPGKVKKSGEAWPKPKKSGKVKAKKSSKSAPKAKSGKKRK